MRKITTRRKILEISQKIVQGYAPDKIVLFGSYAWGKPHVDSDIDFLIIKRTKKRSIERERELRALLFGNRFPPLDLIIYTPVELKKRLAMNDSFVSEIMNSGKIIYGK